MGMTVDAGALVNWMGRLTKPPSELTVGELNAAATELKVPLPDLMQFVSMFAAGPAPGGGNKLQGGLNQGAVVPTPQKDLYGAGPGDYVAQTKKGAELVDNAGKAGQLKNVASAFFYEPELSATVGVRSSLPDGPEFQKARDEIKQTVSDFLKRSGLPEAAERVFVAALNGGFPV